MRNVPIPPSVVHRESLISQLEELWLRQVVGSDPRHGLLCGTAGREQSTVVQKQENESGVIAGEGDSRLRVGAPSCAL
jgi:hypothetical protein